MATELSHHLARHNHSLRAKIDKLREKGAKATGKAVRTLEVAAGAAIGGVIQGMAKDPTTGARILHVPADLGIGLGLNLASLMDLAGSEWSHHLGNLGDGFLGAYFSDLGFHVGQRKAATGSFFGPKGASPMLAPPMGPPPPAVKGEVSPQQMAAHLLNQMQAQP